MFRWGLIPFFARNRNSIPLIINARAETLAEKPAFRQAFKRKRGLVVMSGFYEWCEENHARQPFYIAQKQRRLLAVAALWDTWQSPENEVIHSCCLVATEGNPLVHAIHARMPVILNDREQGLWMDNTHFDSSLLMSLLHPYKGADLTVWPVTPKMNNWRFNNSEAIVRVK